MKRNLILLCTLLCINMAASAVLVWDGTSAPWTNGSGTETDPYLIETPQQLSYLAEMTSAGVSDYKGKYFLQTQDFDMESFVFTPIGTFRGNYNGSGKSISNLRISGDNGNNNIALFGYVVGATIENVIVGGSFSCTSSGVTYAAGIVASGYDVKLSNCKNMADIKVNSRYAAGVIAYARASTLINCSNGGSVNSTIFDSSSDQSYAGGVVGYCSDCTVANCSNTGSIGSSFLPSYVGTGEAYSGGIVGGCRDCAMVKCSNTGSVNSSLSTKYGYNLYSHSGGIAGVSAGMCTLALCSNTGSVKSYSYSNSYNYVCSGGIVGKQDRNSSHSLIVKNCYARCAVNATTYSYGQYKYAYAFGIAAADSIQNSYFAGTLEGLSKYGISEDGSQHVVTNSYFNSDCGASTSGKGTAKTTAQLKSASMPVILNGSQAEPVWVMDTDNSNDGYPIFGWQAAPSYQITGTCDAKQGVVSGSGKYAAGTVVQLTASPSDGYAFVSWSDGDTTNPRSITVGTADATYTALFVKMHYTITIGQDCSTTVQ